MAWSWISVFVFTLDYRAGSSSNASCDTHGVRCSGVTCLRPVGLPHTSNPAVHMTHLADGLWDGLCCVGMP